MGDARILSIGRAVPQRRYTQHEVHAHNPWEDTALIDRLFLESPVHTRALYVPPQWYRTERTLSETNEAWRAGALQLSGDALEQALSSSHTPRADLDLLAVTTVTGYTTPGLDLLLAKQHDLPHTLSRVHFNNIGCHAAVPLLRVAADHVRQRPGTRAAAVAVEVCSACFANVQTPENLVALSLFADGAATAIISSEPDATGPQLVDFASIYDFDHMEALGFGLTSGGFRIVLDPAIPHIIGARIAEVVDHLLQRNGVRKEDVDTWAFHPGGSRILDEAQRALSLPDSALIHSRRVLRAYGNMSSPSVLFVLADAMESRTPGPGWAIAAAFGPGLGIEAALLHFDA